MSDNNARWMVKDKTGRIVGPLTTVQVLDLISQLILSGEEMVARHPNGEWISISKEAEFYDRLLEVLSSGASTDDDPDTKGPNPVEPQFELDHPGFAVTEAAPTEKIISGPSEKNPESDPTVLQTRTRPKVIDLKELKPKSKKRSKARRSKLPFFLALILGLVGALLIFPSGKSENKMRLIAPRKGQPALKQAEIEKMFKPVIAEFQKDNFDSYRKAMNILVPVAEGAPRNASVHQLLCLIYRELWPFTNQDQKDESVVLAVSKMTEEMDPGGVASATCRLVSMMIKGRVPDAKNLVDSSIESYPTAAVFYEIKGELTGGQATSFMFLDSRAGASYMEKAEQLWPQWLKPKVATAVFAEKSGNVSLALQKLRETLQVNSQHDVARAFYGIFTYRRLGKSEAAVEQLLPIAGSRQLHQPIAAEANLVLAQIYDKFGDKSNALKYAQKSYQLNPGGRAAQNLIRRYGGDPSAIKVSEDLVGALYIGDQFYLKGDFFAAMAEYKAAFEVNKKNGLAALKAAKCYWKLNQFKEALVWLDKAIGADSKLIEAYVTKAEYYTERYDFYGADLTLRKAQSANKNNYEILRGYALLELKRNNFQLSEAYALKSLKVHDTDLQTHIILAKAQLGMAKFQEAFVTAAKVLELDVNSTEAQDTYVKVLAAVQGVDAAVYYTKGVIENYPRTLGYRVILADLLYQDERYTDAEMMYRQITQIDPTKKEAFWGLGRSIQAQGKYQNAIDPLLKAATLDPGDANSSFYLGQLYMAAGQNEKALKNFERVVGINSVFPRAHLFLGKVALALNNFELALKEAEQEQVVSPNSAEGFLLAAEIYTQQKRYSNCTQELQKALKLNVAGAMTYVNMAKCYRLSGSPDAAISMINIAQERESGLPEVYLELGQGYEMKGDNIAAIEAYNQYLVLSPNGKDGAFVRQRIQSLGK
ncbi:MAG: tetratricopeptide repeat protein [Pseudomonadota bacterium]|nr:tetratricopeptide repeat protein [Pseudomonadota bacterium]